ncbi:nucleotide pyrophosphohydrolase [Candidatus Saccharibacteria bacterium]|nr:MAG: nucleotide pyrophosphohydrolase [Candidatus Saccharibacteria bacterium]
MTKKVTFEEVYSTVMQYVMARKWDKTNDSRGLAVSLSLEANELLEYFQWHDDSFGSKEDMASELADIMIYAIQFADRYGIDIPDAIAKKIEMQDKKYPKEIFEIEDEKERNARWLEAKRNYRKDTTL